MNKTTGHINVNLWLWYCITGLQDVIEGKWVKGTWLSLYYVLQLQVYLQLCNIKNYRYVFVCVCIRRSIFICTCVCVYVLHDLISHDLPTAMQVF